ncbi:hypothetical protein ABT026_30195 [Streptomyces sp. NPDC002734]|uniref:hypothetical protein n=1 Tax=Streptomyces sp. NPDC002734 TaxID=3154426 RepID=UPI003329C767
MPTGDRGDGMESGRIQKTVNVVLCLAAVAGSIWGGTVIWEVLSNRHRINQACDDLVPARNVLALSPAGGDITHRLAEEGTIDLSQGLPQDCELFSTEAGEKIGSRTGSRWFFTGAVGALDQDDESPETPSSSVLNDGNPYKSTTHAAQPLGGGITGLVTDAGVTVFLPCPGGEVEGRRVKELWARAGLMTGRPFTAADQQITGADRDVLAETAALTANNLAERAGCPDRLPDAPEDIPALPEGTSPASQAKGTCAWYAENGFARRPAHPDEVLESRVDDRLPDERCVLFLSGSRASAATERNKGADRPRYGFREADWFVSFHTYRGVSADNVTLRSSGLPGSGTPAEPGTAGRSSQDPMWWASSVCAGNRPQVHTMTSSHAYDRVAPPRDLERLFRAYVQEVASRRDCAPAEFPPATDFAPPGEKD